MHLRPLFVFATAALLVAGAAPARPAGAPPEARQTAAAPDAPGFSVERFSDGRTITLSDVRGKVALLYFFYPS